MYSNQAPEGVEVRVKAGVGVIVFDPEGRVLLERRSDNGRWGLPGGAVDPGESVALAAVREVREETGLTVEISDLVGVYSDPAEGRVVTYPDNGDVRHLVDTVVTARIRAGSLRLSGESLELAFFAPDALPEDIVPPARLPLRDALARRFGQLC